MFCRFFFFFKQKTAYEMRISDWSSDVCSSDLDRPHGRTEKLALNQLSGGYRIVLALVADLSRRMATANPHLSDPLQSEAIVLIDEENGRASCRERVCQYV